VLDNEIVAVGCAPIPGLRGRSPDGEVKEAGRMWGIVESAHPDMVRQIVEPAGRVEGGQVAIAGGARTPDGASG
jgi:hypothetical protein